MISSAANRRPWSASQGVVSDEFVTGNGLTSSTAPMISNLFPAGAKPASTGEVILWGYVDDPMSLPRRGRGTLAMVATLKRPPPEAAARHHAESQPASAGRKRFSSRPTPRLFRANIPSLSKSRSNPVLPSALVPVYRAGNQKT